MSGAEVLRGDVGDLDVLRAGAEQADGVVHLAFRHDVAFAGDFDTALASNQAAIEALGEALAGTGRPLAIASGIPVEPGRVATERDRARTVPGAAGRYSTSAQPWPSPIAACGQWRCASPRPCMDRATTASRP